MEDCSLLKIQKGSPLTITCTPPLKHYESLGNGSEECFRKHEKKIITALNNGEISWKRYSNMNIYLDFRQDQKSPYPLHIKFRIKCAPYKEDLIVKPADEPSSISSVAFFHVYFIYAEVEL